jgi:N utilization substance protein B
MLYAADLAHHDAETLVTDFWREFPGDATARAYADDAVRGVLAERPRIDEHVVKASLNWRLERMTPIARNVLRLGTWELMSRLEVPRAVIIDESVEVAKRYGGSDAGAFVNGVLDRIADACGRHDEPRGAPRASRRPATTSIAPADVPADAVEDTEGLEDEDDDWGDGIVAGPGGSDSDATLAPGAVGLNDAAGADQPDTGTSQHGNAGPHGKDADPEPGGDRDA